MPSGLAPFPVWPKGVHPARVLTFAQNSSSGSVRQGKINALCSIVLPKRPKWQHYAAVLHSFHGRTAANAPTGRDERWTRGPRRCDTH